MVRMIPDLAARSPAVAALLEFSRSDPGPSTLRDLSPAESAELFRLAAHHGQLGALLLRLERDRCLAPENARALLLLRRQAALWDLERNAVMGRLVQSGIPAVLLKGAALRLTAYHDPVERSFGDIDILVPREYLTASVQALEEIGYRGQAEDLAQLYVRLHHHLILSRPPGFKVEVHWALQPVRYPLVLDHTDFLNEAVEVTMPDGKRIRVPRDEHMVLHSAVQCVEDGFSRLRRLVDIDRIISSSPGFDWDLLAREVRRLRLESVTVLSLRLTEILVGVTLPPGFLASLHPPWSSRLHLSLLDPVELILNAMEPRTAVRRLMLLWSIADPRARLHYAGGLLSGEADRFGRALRGDSMDTTHRMFDAVGFIKLALYQISLYRRLVDTRRARIF